MKILFLGTPAIAVPYLQSLIDHHDVVGVVCKKDEPVGRGYKITPPPVKVLAQKHNIPVFQPEGPWTDEVLNQLKELNADVGVAVAYGRLVPDQLIQTPKFGIFNIHFSLLPKYRGAGPMQWSLINGETETGVTAFWIVKEMDAGPICGVEKVAVDPEDDAFTLEAKLVPAGLKAMDRVLADLSEGNVVKKDQQGEPSLAPIIKKEMGVIDWSKPAVQIRNLIRGTAEWPVARTFFQPEGGEKKILKIFKASLVEGKKGQPGTIIDVVKNQGPVVQTGEGALLLTEVQPEGKKKMPAWSFWQGARMKAGDKFI